MLRGRVAARAVARRLQRFVARLALRRIATRALKPPPRGFVPRDVPLLRKLTAQLRVEWCTRDIHPWDRGLPADQQAARFLHQTLHDTDAAIARFFDMLPEIEALDVRVLEPEAPNRLILAGFVARADARATRALSSPAMRLRMMGVRCQLADGRLAPLE